MLLRSVVPVCPILPARLAAPEAADRSHFKTLQSLRFGDTTLSPVTSSPGPLLLLLPGESHSPSPSRREVPGFCSALNQKGPENLSLGDIVYFQLHHHFQTFGAGSKPFPQPLIHPENHLRASSRTHLSGSSNVTCPKRSWPPFPSVKPFNNYYTRHRWSLSSTRGRQSHPDSGPASLQTHFLSLPALPFLLSAN